MLKACLKLMNETDFFLSKTNRSKNFATDHQFALLVTCILKKIVSKQRFCYLCVLRPRRIKIPKDAK